MTNSTVSFIITFVDTEDKETIVCARVIHGSLPSDFGPGNILEDITKKVYWRVLSLGFFEKENPSEPIEAFSVEPIDHEETLKIGDCLVLK